MENRAIIVAGRTGGKVAEDIWERSSRLTKIPGSSLLFSKGSNDVYLGQHKHHSDENRGDVLDPTGNLLFRQGHTQSAAQQVRSCKTCYAVGGKSSDDLGDIIKASEELQTGRNTSVVPLISVLVVMTSSRDFRFFKPFFVVTRSIDRRPQDADCFFYTCS